MSSASAALAATPSKVRSKINNDPAQRHGRSVEARRVRDLFAAYSATPGNPTEVVTQALVLAASEAVAIAELTRASYLLLWLAELGCVILRLGSGDAVGVIASNKRLISLVQLGGLEPPTSCSTATPFRSARLSMPKHGVHFSLFASVT